MNNDTVLLDECAKTQHAEAFNELVEKYSGLVYSACLRITGNIHEAEEIAQDCFSRSQKMQAQ